MKHLICSDRKTVREFLVQMQAILTDPDFDIGSDIVIQRKKRKDDFLSSYTTEHTMLELGYNTNDVVEELKKLTIAEYNETIIDHIKPAENLARFYVFGHEIEGRMIYVKVRIKERQTRSYVFCISFHFAEFPITKFPHASTRKG